MKTIRIDDVVFSYLQSKAKPFEDSPNDVLRRELKLLEEHPTNGHRQKAGELRSEKLENVPDGGSTKDYSFRSVSGFTLQGRKFPARSFKDVIVNLMNHLRAVHKNDFDKAALRIHGKKRSYFLPTPEGLKFPEQLSGNGLFVETNLSANGVMKISGRVLSELGYDVREFDLI